MRETTRGIPTSVGQARITTTPGLRGTIVLGHGAGGLRWSADIVAVRDATAASGWGSVLVDQPWRVAGRRVATRPPTLDAAWREVLRTLADLPRPLVVGGRSAGARVACRTAVEVGADAVLCLAFPLHPPGRPGSSRAGELLLPVAAGLPVRVIQGSRDPFGSPEEVRAGLTPGGEAVAVPGTHSFAVDAATASATVAWLGGLLAR